MMKRYKQFDNLVVSDFEVEQWQHPLHNHNHFELIFIAKGHGLHRLNGMASSYRRGDLFLLGPEDAHEFEVKKRSRFIYFKFTKLYVTQPADLPLPDHWNRDMDQLLYHPERKKGNLLHITSDRLLVQELMQMIADEYRKKRILHQKIIFQLFSVVMFIVKRNGKVYELQEEQHEKSGMAEELMEYIALNIYEPEKLTLKSLAGHFHYSPHYIGILFKEKMGSTLRDYVSHYRFRLIEQRLKFSQAGMKQIAFEFGFVDESHLHKFIKNKTGKSLREMRG